MKWNETRRRLLELAKGRHAEAQAALADELEAAPSRPEPDRAWQFHGPEPAAAPDERSPAIPREPYGAPRARSLCIASGKGGTGKSVLAASLSSALGVRGRTLIVDADLGVGNAHILQDVSPTASLVDVVDGSAQARDVLVKCSGQIDLLAAGSGVPRMADLSKYEMHLVATGLEELELDYRFLVVDSAAGISRQTVAFAKACDSVLIVTTPDLTAMTDAYAFLKVLCAKHPECRPMLLVNRAAGDAQAQEVIDRITRVARRFLGEAPLVVGWLPEDPVVASCVNRRGDPVLLEPAAPFSRALSGVAVRVLEELGRHHPRGMGRTLLEDIGYPSHLP